MSEAQADEIEQPPLHEKIDQMLTEARVILPGAQALLGFQLAIVLTDAFEKMPGAVKLTHGAALGCVALSIILLMTPAAYHRIVYGGEDSEALHRIGSWFVTWSTVPLAFGLAADVAVVGTKSSHRKRRRLSPGSRSSFSSLASGTHFLCWPAG